MSTKVKTTNATKAILKKDATKTSGSNAVKAKEGRQPKEADTPFRVHDPRALLIANPLRTKETIEAIAGDKKLDRTRLRSKLHTKIAYRLALLGLVGVDTLARNAKSRIYMKTSKTNMRSLKAVMAA
jgi:hypothetical protein